MQEMKKETQLLRTLLEDHESPLGKKFGYFLIGLILLSTFMFVLETTSLKQQYASIFHTFDIFAMSVFTLEYVLRIMVHRRKWRVILSPLGLIDLFVLLSFYITYLNFTVLRGFRVLRILQVLKIIRYSEVVVAFAKAFRHYKNEVLIFFIVFGMSLLISSTGMYYLEGNVNPGYATIPDSLWWTVVTVTTLGYGNIVPITAGGKFLTTFIVMGGLGSIAIMTAVVTKVFMDHFFGKRQLKCKACKYPNHDFDAMFCKKCGNELLHTAVVDK